MDMQRINSSSRELKPFESLAVSKRGLFCQQFHVGITECECTISSNQIATVTRRTLEQWF